MRHQIKAQEYPLLTDLRPRYLAPAGFALQRYRVDMQEFGRLLGVEGVHAFPSSWRIPA